jgi:hypothetical protein
MWGTLKDAAGSMMGRPAVVGELEATFDESTLESIEGISASRLDPPRLIARSSVREERQVAGVVILLLESTRASSITGVYTTLSHNDGLSSPSSSSPSGRSDGSGVVVQKQRVAPHSLAPSRPGFLSELAHRKGTKVARFAFPRMPNTNKCLLETLCGLTPLIATSWEEVEPPYLEAVQQECLPKLLHDRQWETFFANPTASVKPSKTIQKLIGFDQVFFKDSLYSACRQDLEKREKFCSSLRLNLDDDCLDHLFKIVSLDEHKIIRKLGGQRSRKSKLPAPLRTFSLSTLISRVLKARVMLQSSKKNNDVNQTQVNERIGGSPKLCGEWSGPVPSLEAIDVCFASPCTMKLAALNQTAFSNRLKLKNLVTDDTLMLQPSLQFVENAAAKGKPFLLTLLTLATHHDYSPKGLRAPLLAVRPPTPAPGSSSWSSTPRKNYASAVRDTEEMARELMAGLRKLQVADRTLLVVLGDHGEAFGEGEQNVFELLFGGVCHCDCVLMRLKMTSFFVIDVSLNRSIVDSTHIVVPLFCYAV